MNDEASLDAGIQKHMLDAVGDALTAAFIVYDKNDLMIFASRQVLSYFPVSSQLISPGTRLRDFLGAVYDSGIRFAHLGNVRPTVTREDWIADRIATHWRERCDTVERHGPDRWVRIVKRRLSSGYGIFIITDVSEHKKREEQWRADLERVQLTEEILDTLPFPVVVKDRSLTYVAVNRAYCALRGLGSDELLGRTLFDVMVPDLAARHDTSDRHVMDTGLSATITERLMRADGREFTVVNRKQRIGKPGRYFLVTTVEDVSDAESKIDDVPPPQHDGAAVPAAPHPDPLSLETFFPDRFIGRKVLLVTDDVVVETAAMKAFARLGVEACTVRNDAEEEAFLDIAASVGVYVDLVVVDAQMDMRALELPKRHGIEALALDGFQFSTQLAYLVVRHFNRRKLIDVPSLDPVDDWDIATGQEARAPEHGVQVLVVEDNDINRIVFSQILEGLGYSYMVATDGAEAVDFWERHTPAIVLMDTTLPVMNGFDAAREIRAREANRPLRTPIIGVLAQAFDQDRDRCLASGMDDIIMKPLSPDIIEAVFDTFLGSGFETSAS